MSVCNQGANITSNDSYYDNVKLAMSVTMFRRGPPGSEVVVDKWEQPLDVVQRAQLARIIRGDNSTTLTVPRMYPRAVRLPASDSTMLVDTQREKWLGLVLQAQVRYLVFSRIDFVILLTCCGGVNLDHTKFTDLICFTSLPIFFGEVRICVLKWAFVHELTGMRIVRSILQF